jgi:hypothetical protein
VPRRPRDAEVDLALGDAEVDLPLDAQPAGQHAQRGETQGAGLARHPSLAREPVRLGLSDELVDAHAGEARPDVWVVDHAPHVCSYIVI